MGFFVLCFVLREHFGADLGGLCSFLNMPQSTLMSTVAP